MDREAIQKAAKCLLPKGVMLVNSTVTLSPAFDTYTAEKNKATPLHRGGHLDDYKMIEDKDDGGEIIQRTIKYKYECGICLVQADHVNDVIDGNIEPEMLVEMSAVFCSIYDVIENDLDRVCLDEFNKYNVGYHVWPYWREYVQSTCSRMGITVIPVPIYDVKNK